MPYLRKTKIFSIFLALVYAPFFFAYAEPAGSPIKEGVQSELGRLAESLNLLSAMKAGGRPTDVVALQSALSDILRLSEEEVRTISVRLAAQNGLAKKEEVIQESLIADLANLKIRMKSIRADATQEAGPTAVMAIAQKFKEWRDGPYAEVMEKAATFVGVFENEDAIKAANGRLNAILKDEKKIRALLPLPKTSAFMRLIKKAQASLRKAADLNTQAKALLDPETERVSEDMNIDTITAESNTLIASAYDDFITMSKLIKK